MSAEFGTAIPDEQRPDKKIADELSLLDLRIRAKAEYLDMVTANGGTIEEKLRSSGHKTQLVELLNTLRLVFRSPYQSVTIGVDEFHIDNLRYENFPHVPPEELYVLACEGIKLGTQTFLDFIQVDEPKSAAEVLLPWKRDHVIHTFPEHAVDIDSSVTLAVQPTRIPGVAVQLWYPEGVMEPKRSVLVKK